MSPAVRARAWLLLGTLVLAARHGARDGTDPDGARGGDHGEPAPLPHPAAVLELLRVWDRDKNYERMLAAGIKPNLAKLTLARKIAATVLSMWKHQEVCDPQRHGSASDKT